MFGSIVAKTDQALRCVFAGLIVLYRACISPWLAQRCRFYPSCSSYAQDALQHHPIHRAWALIVRRLLKCHPLHPGGVDCPPEPTLKTALKKGSSHA